MFGIKLETRPDLISVYKLIGDLKAGLSSSNVADCDLFVHAGCRNSTFCGTCPAAHSDNEQLTAALEGNGFRKKMIFSSDEPNLGTAIELTAPDGSGSIRLETHQAWLQSGIGRRWMIDETNIDGMLIGESTLSVIASEKRDSTENVHLDQGDQTLSMLFNLALAEL